MTSFIIAIPLAFVGLSLTAAVVLLVACSMWQIVYYGCGCRRHPIGKTALLTAAFIWIVSACIINFM